MSSLFFNPTIGLVWFKTILQCSWQNLFQATISLIYLFIL